MEGEILITDVLIEILVDLPIKSLMRFRCVSKDWCALINSPIFVTTHLKRDRKGTVLLKRRMRPGGHVLSFHDSDSLDLLVSPNLSIPQCFNDLIIDECNCYMGTCNGLVCLAISEKIVLCNPALREFELLPPTPFPVPEGHWFRCSTRFGFDAITNAYKVVQIWILLDKKKDYPQMFEEALVRIDLYNCSINSWRVIDAVVPRVVDDHGFNVFLNGACHWRVCGGNILTFDLNTEVFQQLEYPSYGEKFPVLGVLNNCLSVLLFDEQFVDVWVMKEYGVKESWTKVCALGPYNTINYPILLLKNECLLMMLSEQLTSLALYDNVIKRFHIDEIDESMRALIFKESLISLKQIISCCKKD